MSKKILKSLDDFRQDMIELGYTVRVTTNSAFRSAKVLRAGVQINAGNVLTPEHIAAHRAFYDYKNAYSVRDGDMVVTF